MPPETKYASEGGPTFKDCFELLRRVAARPAVDVLKLLDAVIFNLIVGNADAHGKNFSILYDREGPRLAPLYDLLATVAYPELSPKLAMRIGKRATLGEMDAKGWIAFAADAGVGVPLIRRRVSEVSQTVIARANEVASELMRPGPDEAALSRFAAIEWWMPIAVVLMLPAFLLAVIGLTTPNPKRHKSSSRFVTDLFQIAA